MVLAQHTEKTDKNCNVCGSAVEIVECTASQCSNLHCLTRERGDGFKLANSLTTDSTDAEIAQYWEERAKKAEGSTALTNSEARERALSAFEDYYYADGSSEAEEAETRAQTFLELTDKGWGWLKEESDV